jgi:hypothetical protein
MGNANGRRPSTAWCSHGCSCLYWRTPGCRTGVVMLCFLLTLVAGCPCGCCLCACVDRPCLLLRCSSQQALWAAVN